MDQVAEIRRLKHEVYRAAKGLRVNTDGVRAKHLRIAGKDSMCAGAVCRQGSSDNMIVLLPRPTITLILTFIGPCNSAHARESCSELCACFLPALRDLAKEGEVSALSTLGRFHVLGVLGVKVSKAVAVDLWEQAAGKGCSRSAYDAGMLLKEDETDLPRMRNAWELGASLGHPGCMHNLAQCLEKGIGGPLDQRQAFDWDRMGADKGSQQAAFRCGFTLWDGIEGVVPRDRPLAVKYWKVAAERGHSEAMYCMALVHDISFSNSTDPARRQTYLRECCEWLDRAGQAGCLHPRACGVLQDAGAPWATDGFRPSR